MYIERVTSYSQAILHAVMSDPDAITYALEPPCIGASHIYFLIKTGDEGEVAGYCDLHSIDMLGRTAWTTIYIRKDARAGIVEANDVYKQLIKFAWNDLNLRKVYADNNSKVLSRWMEKSGWTREGRLVKAKFVDGKFVDQNIFALFREESE